MQSKSLLTKLSNDNMSSDHILTLSCPDKPGIVHAVTGVFATHGHNILDLQQFSDPASERSFMRVHFAPTTKEGSDPSSTAHLTAPLESLAQTWTMDYDVRPMTRKMRVLIMVSKIGHCLNDLLFRMKTGQLRIEVNKHFTHTCTCTCTHALFYIYLYLINYLNQTLKERKQNEC